MGIESFLLASSARLIVAPATGEDAVRSLCKETHPLSATDARRRRSAIRRSASRRARWSAGPRAASGAASRGFRGRKGVFEIMEVGPALRRSIGPKTDASATSETAARRRGHDHHDRGRRIQELRAGQTTLDEIFRLTTSL